MNPSLKPLRSRTVSLMEVGDAGLLIRRDTGGVHRLNTTARLVWQLLDGTATVDELIAEIVDEVDAPSADVSYSVRAVVEQLASAGLLDGVDGDVPLTPDVPVPPTVPRPTPPPPDQVVGPFVAVGLPFEIAFTGSEELGAEIQSMLRPLAGAPDGGRDVPLARFSFWDDDSGWHVQSPHEYSVSEDARAATDFLMWHVNWMVMQSASRYLMLHASVVARDGVAIVMPAVANGGKSTLAAALVQAGYDYLSDELAVIDLDRAEVVPYPKPIGIDPGSQELFPEFAPGDGDRRRRWYLDPDQLRAGSIGRRAKLGHLVFPAYEPAGANVLTTVDPLTATETALSHAFNLSDHHDRLDRIAELLSGTPAHTLRQHGLTGPVAAMATLW